MIGLWSIFGAFRAKARARFALAQGPKQMKSRDFQPLVLSGGRFPLNGKLFSRPGICAGGPLSARSLRMDKNFDDEKPIANER